MGRGRWRQPSCSMAPCSGLDAQSGGSSTQVQWLLKEEGYKGDPAKVALADMVAAPRPFLETSPGVLE